MWTVATDGGSWTETAGASCGSITSNAIRYWSRLSDSGSRAACHGGSSISIRSRSSGAPPRRSGLSDFRQLLAAEDFACDTERRSRVKVPYSGLTSPPTLLQLHFLRMNPIDSLPVSFIHLLLPPARCDQDPWEISFLYMTTQLLTLSLHDNSTLTLSPPHRKP